MYKSSRTRPFTNTIWTNKVRIVNSFVVKIFIICAFRSLQEQTDRALLDTQSQLTQIEIEYTHSQERVRELERDRALADNEIGCLRSEISIVKSSLAKLDSEKDALVVSNFCH